MNNIKFKKIAQATAFFTGNLFTISAVGSSFYYNAGTITANIGGVTPYTSYSVAPGQTFYISASSKTGAQPTLQFYNSSNNVITVGGQSEYVIATLTATQVVAGSNSISSFVFFGLPNSVTTVTGLCISSTSAGCSASVSTSSVTLAPNAYALRSVYNIQSAALDAGLSYDCNMFDKQGFCLSTGGRYSTTNSPETNTTSGLLIGSYKYDKHIRLGAWVDQNLSTNNTTGMTLSNSNPLFGVFGAWAERNDGLGYEVKVSAGYGDKDVTVIRTSTNQGSTQLRMRGISTVSSFGFAIDGGLIAAPYVGVKYTSINRGAYTEGGSSALSYDNLRQESTTAVAGVRLSGKIDNQTGFVVSAGAEHDLNHNVGQYSAGSSNTTAFNSNVQKTRPVVTAGVFYDIDKTQRIGVNAIHRQEPFQSTTSTTGLVTYTVGF